MKSEKGTCAKCGGSISSFESAPKRSALKHNHPDSPYVEKGLCNSCFDEVYSQIPTKDKGNSANNSTITNKMEIYCPKCGKLFLSERLMLEHYSEVHRGILKPKPQPSVQESPKIEPIKKTPIKIDVEDVHKEALFTKNALSYLSVFAGLLLTGLFLANPVFLYISLVPLFFVVTGVILDQPKSVLFDRHEMKSNCFTGEVIEVATDVVIDAGCGFLVLRDNVPKHFEVVEGKNLKIVWKGLKPKKDTLIFKVRCTKRGIYTFDKINWEFRHVLGFRQTVVGEFSQEKILSVQLRNILLRRVRNTKTLSRLPLPLGALNKTGISTTDFREIREYSPGDPYKNINWKITARMSSKTFTKPFVNEFEKEGKKFVWIFIDGSYSMGSHGTVISNAFEHAIAAANDLSQYYLERDCFVGVYLYNKKHRLIYPDVGRKQRFKISKELISMEMDQAEPLRESVQRCRSRLVGTAPLSIIITALSENKTNDLIEGIKELKKYNKTFVKSSILVINVKSYGFAANTEEEKLSAKILQCNDYPIESKLRSAGTMVVDWNPVEQPLTHVLLSEVRRR
jgi:uncharacterized protein (DUF58 family)